MLPVVIGRPADSSNPWFLELELHTGLSDDADVSRGELARAVSQQDARRARRVTALPVPPVPSAPGPPA